MRVLVLAALLLPAVPAVATAAPLCVADSLAGYVALGAEGCELGGATFAGFSSAPSFFGGDEVAAADISVVPTVTAQGPRLDFGLDVMAGAGDVAGVVIGYSGMASFTGLTLSMDGAQADPPDAVVTAVADICLDGSFAGDPTTCSGMPDALIVAQDFVGPTGPDARMFAALVIAVLLDITVDGGVLGSASLDGLVTNQFVVAQAVPEPAVLLLMGFGFGVLGTWLRRRRACTPH